MAQVAACVSDRMTAHLHTVRARGLAVTKGIEKRLIKSTVLASSRGQSKLTTNYLMVVDDPNRDPGHINKLSMSLAYPPSATKPDISIADIAQASSLSELSPVIPTAPRITPSFFTNTPPATGTRDPSESAFIA